MARLAPSHDRRLFRPQLSLFCRSCSVNADIRKPCDELAEQGFVAVAADPFWRQEPGVGKRRTLGGLLVLARAPPSTIANIPLAGGTPF